MNKLFSKNMIFKFATILTLSISLLNINVFASAGTWENDLTKMTTARRNLSSITYNNKIYTIGGIEGQTPSNKIEVYDIETNQWNSISNMPIPRYSHESVLYKDKIYILGGYNKTDGFLDRVDIYDLKTNTWSIGAYMPIPKSSFVAEAINGKIYCIGGELAYGNYSDSLEIYDIETNSWIQSKNLSIARGDIDGVYKDGKIYIIGGYNGKNILDSVDAYDIESGTWTTLSKINTPRYSLSVTVYKNEIYALGGYNSSHLATNKVEKYNILNDTWEYVEDMIDVKGGATAQSYYGNIYLIGGHNDIQDVSSILCYKAQSPNINEIAIDAVEKAEESRSQADIEIAKELILQVTEEELKNDLINRISSLDEGLDIKTATSNIDVYIESENALLMSLDTNSIIFDNFSGVTDMEKPNAVNITVSSSLPYQLNSYLPTQIQNTDKSNIMDNNILNIKENSESIYQTFINTTDKIILKDNCVAGINISHGVDIKLKGSIAHEKDVYKTTIRFEVTQK